MPRLQDLSATAHESEEFAAILVQEDMRMIHDLIVDRDHHVILQIGPELGPEDQLGDGRASRGLDFDIACRSGLAGVFGQGEEDFQTTNSCP